MLATNNIPDVIMVSQGDLNNYGRKGAFVNLSDHKDLMPNYMAARDADTNLKLTEVDGKVFSFAKISYDIMYGGNGPAIRTDLLKKHNIAAPTSYEELYNVLKQLKTLYPDSYPWTSRGLWSCIDSVALGNGTVWGIKYDPDRDGGRYSYGFIEPEMEYVLSYMNRLYAEQLLDPDFATNNNDTFAERLSTGRSFFIMNNVNFIDNYNQGVQSVTPDAMFEMIPMLKGQNGVHRGHVAATQGFIGSGYAISSKVKDPSGIIKFFDWLYSDEGKTITNFGKLGETCKDVNGTIEFDDSILRDTKADSDDYKEIELGLTHNAMALYVCQRQWYANDHDYQNQPMYQRSIQIKNDPGFTEQPSIDPPFTEEETQELKDIQTRCNTISDENTLKFIIGERPMSEFSKFVEELKAAGAERMVEIYNQAYDRVK